jgi:hypothetical protein
MGQNFLACDRDQELLLPPSLREWLAENHLAWFVLDIVAELDLDRFYGALLSGRLGSLGARPADDGRAVGRRLRDPASAPRARSSAAAARTSRSV